MPVMNHLGQTVEWRGSGGERYAVYVMGPSGLITIDPGITFTPPSGLAYAEGYYQVQVTLACSAAAVWTFSLPSGVTATVGSGGSSTVVTFTLTSGSISKPLARTVQFAATGTSGSTTATYTVQIVALAND